MLQELFSKLMKKIKGDIDCQNNSQLNGIQDIYQKTIRFSKKFEKNLLNNQNKLLIEEISRQYRLFFDIHQKYINFLDPNEEQMISKIVDLKTISISEETKPPLVVIINQNNKIDAMFKKIDYARRDSQKKAYLKNFLTNDMDLFVVEKYLKEFEKQKETEKKLAYASSAFSK